MFDAVADLTTYPRWLSIVLAAEAAEAAEADDEAAWIVDLGARLGPLKRAKRVRMVRTEHDRPAHVRFERQELDGKEHSPWVLTADVDPAGNVKVHLYYGGAAWLPGLNLVLQQEIGRAPGRLTTLLAD